MILNFFKCFFKCFIIKLFFLNKILICIYFIFFIDNGVLVYFLGNWWCFKIDFGVVIFVVCGVEGVVFDLFLVVGVIIVGVFGFKINIYVLINLF